MPIDNEAIRVYANRFITEENIKKLSQIAGGVFPGAGVAVSILGAIVLRVLNNVNKYIEEVKGG